MAKVENINVTLDKLANYSVTIHNDTTGQVANDRFITDVARTIVNVPIYAAKNKRSYIEKMYADMMAYVSYDNNDKVASVQSDKYYQAKERYEYLAPILDDEAIAFDHIAETYKAWFKEYTGQDYLESTRNQPKQLSKEKQAKLAAIEARRVAAA